MTENVALQGVGIAHHVFFLLAETATEEAIVGGHWKAFNTIRTISQHHNAEMIEALRRRIRTVKHTVASKYRYYKAPLDRRMARAVIRIANIENRVEVFDATASYESGVGSLRFFAHTLHCIVLAPASPANKKTPTGKISALADMIALCFNASTVNVTIRPGSREPVSPRAIARSECPQAILFSMDRDLSHKQSDITLLWRQDYGNEVSSNSIKKSMIEHMVISCLNEDMLKTCPPISNLMHIVLPVFTRFFLNLTPHPSLARTSSYAHPSLAVALVDLLVLCELTASFRLSRVHGVDATVDAWAQTLLRRLNIPHVRHLTIRNCVSRPNRELRDAIARHGALRYLYIQVQKPLVNILDFRELYRLLDGNKRMHEGWLIEIDGYRFLIVQGVVGSSASQRFIQDWAQFWLERGITISGQMDELIRA